MKCAKRSIVVAAILMMAAPVSKGQLVYLGDRAGSSTQGHSFTSAALASGTLEANQRFSSQPGAGDSDLNSLKGGVYSTIRDWTGQAFGLSDLTAAAPRPFAQVQSPATFLATAQTDPPSATRLFLDTAEAIPAPTGTTLWLVADLSHNGIQSGQATTGQIQDIISGTGDDRLFFTDTVDGTLLGSQAGKYQWVGISVPSTFQTASIGLVLWNDANQSGTIGDADDTYGFYSFGVVAPPALGNALYIISGNVHADENLVTPVPEPAEVGLAFGLLCIGGALLRRGRRK